jgi:hypothetical protein
VGGTAQFSVTAIGSEPLSYGWQFNGTNLAGSTGSTLTLTNVQTSQSGNYTVVVTNAVGMTVSSNAVLTVNTPNTTLQNGSFELGLTGWTGNNYGVGMAVNTRASEGTNSVGVGGGNATGSVLSQTFSVTPGTTYLVKFDLGTTGNIGLQSVTRVTVVSGTNILASQTFTDEAQGGGMELNYQMQSLLFTVPEDVTAVTLSFADITPNGGVAVDAIIDNVRIEAGAVVPPVTVQPQLGSVDLSLSGISGRQYRIDVSDDLINWNPLSTNQVGVQGSLQCIDGKSTNSVSRFYRSILLP